MTNHDHLINHANPVKMTVVPVKRTFVQSQKATKKHKEHKQDERIDRRAVGKDC
jgi:hypothetical protein